MKLLQGDIGSRNRFVCYSYQPNKKIDTVFNVIVTLKNSSQNISITQAKFAQALRTLRWLVEVQAPMKDFHENFPVPRNTVANELCHGVIALL